MLGWLPDLERWAEVIATVLEPGGTFYLAELHPLTMMLPWEFDGAEMRFEHPYFTTEEPQTFEDSDTYATVGADMEHGTTHNWSHGLGELLTALLDAGLDLSFVHEHPFATFEQFRGMVEDEDGYYRFETDVDLPLTVSVKAANPT